MTLKHWIIFIALFLFGCSGMPSITPISAKLNNAEQVHEEKALVKNESTQQIKADQVEINREIPFNVQLLMIFLAGLALPSLHELARGIRWLFRGRSNER